MMDMTWLWCVFVAINIKLAIDGRGTPTRFVNWIAAGACFIMTLYLGTVI